MPFIPAAVLVYDVEHWLVFIDKQLCRLVDRLSAMGYRHTLEAQGRVKTVGGREYDFTKILPEFREKGVVTVVDAGDNCRVLYSSAHGR